MHGVGALQPRRIGPRGAAQIAADIGRRQADAAQPRNHDVREILADAAAQRERHRRRRGDGGGADLIDDVGLHAADQLDGRLQHGASRRKALPDIVADLRIERDDTAREQKMRGRQRAEVAGRKRRLADVFPGRASRTGQARASTATRADSFTVSVWCGSLISIQVRRLPKKSCPSRRCAGSGTICNAATWTRSPSRDTGVRRST